MITAYSNSLRAESDAKTILAAYGYDVQSDPFLRSVPEEFRNRVKHDVVCPGCFCAGITLVKGGLDNDRFVTQPHFRTQGYPVHSKNCSYLAVIKAEELLGQGQELRSSSGESTEIVARMISLAIANELICEDDFRRYRKWSFDLLAKATWQCLDINMVQALMFFDGAQATRYSGFGLDEIAKLAKKHREGAVALCVAPELVRTIDELQISPHHYAGLTREAIKRIYGKCQLHGVPDLSHLSEFNLHFIRLYNDFRKLMSTNVLTSKLARYWYSTLLGVLLYANDWQIEKVRTNLINLIGSRLPPQRTDLNVIGTHLFEALPSWLMIYHANSHRSLLDGHVAYKTMREETLAGW